MPNRSPQLARFIAAVHRRLVLLRLLESAGLGILVACALNLALMPLLAARPHSPFNLLLPILALGAATGLLWALLRRPTRLAAAAEADRQLNLHDLVTTAWLMRGSIDEASLQASMLAMANERCASLSPATLVLNRLGARAWGSIGLATALVLTIGMLIADPLPTRAGSGGGGLASVDPAHAADGQTILALPRNDASAARQGDPDDRSTRGGSASESAIDWMRGSEPAPPNDAGAGGDPQSGGGTGMAAGRSPHTPAIPLTAGGTQSRGPETGLKTQGGAGAPSISAAAGQATGSRAGNGRSTAAAPWQTPSWPAAAAGALEAVESRQIPAAYQDLVRAYFSRRD